MANLMKKIFFAILLSAMVWAYFAWDLHQLLSLESLKTHVLDLQMKQGESPWLFGLGFFIVYVIATALSLPGAVILTLAAGALFGVVRGTLIVSFASTLGATLSFLVARYLLRDTVQARYADRLKAINEGVKKEGLMYLFTLRLIPLFPFFLINLLMALTPISTLSFYWVSQVGMFAGTVVYVNAGTQLANLNSLSGILSPVMIFSFALLGIFPLIAKGLLAWLARRRVYRQWQRPTSYDRNLIVIGGGAAGLVSAYIAAAVKAKVTLVEAHKMGGDCLNYGCVPSKALIKSARIAQQMRHADHYGLEATTPHFSFRQVMLRVQQVVKAVEPHDSIERYTKLGVDVVQGYARIVDPWTVEITKDNGDKQRLTTRNIIIATGARPFVPPLPGIEDAGYVTSDTMWESFAQLDAPPARLVVLGGGPIGCELAQSFARLGSHVIQIEMAARIMVREDVEVSVLAEAALQRDGVEILTNHKALRCEKEWQNGVETKYIVVEHQGVEKRIAFDALLCAVGRVARLTGFGLEELGIPTQRTVLTNAYLETLYPNIFAAGDVAGPYQFTHTAAHQAWYAAVNALFGEFKKFKVDYSIIPWATFIEPEVARVGLNEQEAQEKSIAYEVSHFAMDELDRAIADGNTQGLIKVLTVPGKDKILGVTIVGEHAGDLLAEYVLAMKHGLGLNKILGTIHTYPTMAEANKYVAGEWKRAHAPEKILALLGKYHAWKRT